VPWGQERRELSVPVPVQEREQQEREQQEREQQEREQQEREQQEREQQEREQQVYRPVALQYPELEPKDVALL
jgi:hypothetical protein